MHNALHSKAPPVRPFRTFHNNICSLSCLMRNYERSDCHACSSLRQSIATIFIVIPSMLVHNGVSPIALCWLNMHIFVGIPLKSLQQSVEEMSKQLPCGLYTRSINGCVSSDRWMLRSRSRENSNKPSCQQEVTIRCSHRGEVSWDTVRKLNNTLPLQIPVGSWRKKLLQPLLSKGHVKFSFTIYN